MVEKVLRFLTFGIVDSRAQPATRPPSDRRTDSDRPRERDRERPRDQERERDRPRDQERERERPRDQDRDRERPRSQDRDRERPRSQDRERGRDREGTEGAAPVEARNPERRERTPDRERERERKAPEPVEPTTERLHVGNLDYDVSEADLYDLFNGVGKVRDAEVVYHKYTQRSKGFAFVVMSSVEEAKRAFEVLNGKEFMGRELWVNGAKSAGPADADGEAENEADDAEDKESAASVS